MKIVSTKDISTNQICNSEIAIVEVVQSQNNEEIRLPKDATNTKLFLSKIKNMYVRLVKGFDLGE